MIQIPTVEDLNAALARVAALESRVAALEKPTPPPVVPPVPPPVVPPVVPPVTKRLVAESDLTFLGAIPVSGGGDLVYGQGFCLRPKHGTFLTFAFKGNGAEIPPPQNRLCEFTLPEVGRPSTLVRSWENIWPGDEGRGGQGLWNGLYVDERDRVWTFSTVDYPGGDGHIETEPNIYVRTLHDDGTVSNFRGPWTLEGEGATHVFAGTQLADGRFLLGGAGYTSRMAADIPASMGPAAYLVNDPTKYPPGLIPRVELMDHSTGDRGVRDLDYLNYLDGGDPRENPPTKPDFPPVPGAKWVPPFPDGLGRATWKDSWRGMVNIDTPDLHGLLYLASFGAGACWYQSGGVYSERTNFGMQVFDLARLSGGNQKPHAMWPVTLPGRGSMGLNGPWGGIAGAGFDSASRRLYAYSPSPGERNCFVYVWKVRG